MQKQNMIVLFVVSAFALVLAACSSTPPGYVSPTLTSDQQRAITRNGETDQASGTKATAIPTAVLEEKQCEDGENVLTHAADAGGILPRLPLGENSRVDVAEISIPGSGSGGYDRGIFVLPRMGTVWKVNFTGARTIHTVGYCGSNDEVADFAISWHVTSLMDASRDTHAQEPDESEIGVYQFNYENGTVTVLKPGRTRALDAKFVKMFDLSFHEGSTESNVALKLVR